jgi:serine/threonine protein kinase
MVKALEGIQSKISGAERAKEEDFEKIQKLGSGSYGVVYLVKRKQDQKQYVLKVIDTKKMSSN